MFIFTKINLSSDQVCRQFSGAFLKQFLKPFELDQPEAFLLPSSELNGTSPDAILSCSFFRFFLSFYIFRRTKFRLFSFSDSNTYSETEISIISLRFGGLEITLVCFSPFVYKVFALFTFHVIVAYGCPRALYLKYYFSQAFSEMKLEV